jgi:hypothetical protein
MSEPQASARRVRVEEVDWPSLLPFLRLFRSFRMAIHPAKLFTALLLVILLYLSGRLLDAMWGRVAYPGEIARHMTSPPDDFNNWLQAREVDGLSDLRVWLYGVEGADEALKSSDPFSAATRLINRRYDTLRQRMTSAAPRSEAGRREIDAGLESLERTRSERIARIREIEPDGVFDTALRFEVNAFERLLDSAMSLHLGYGELLRSGARGRAATPDLLTPPAGGAPAAQPTIVGSLRDMFFVVPFWLFDAHPGFLAAYCLIGFILWTLLGGAIARMAALHATRDERIGPSAGVRFSTQRWPSFVFAPVIPLIVAASIGVVLFLFGLLFFGLPRVHRVTDVLGGLIFAIVILLALVVALLLIGLVMGANLLYPAVAVDGADGFDANSRAFNYVTGRPWQLLFYTLAALVYGAITYLFVATVVFLTLLLAHFLVGWGAGLFMGAAGGAARFDHLFREPDFGRLTYSPDWGTLRTTGKVAAVLIMVWTYLFIGLLGAYAVSYYFTAQTWIYLLLRRSADGTEFDDVFIAPPVPAAATETSARPPDKVEPGAPPAGAGPPI